MFRRRAERQLSDNVYMPLASDGNCDRAYVAFMYRLGAARLQPTAIVLFAFIGKALRIVHACDSGHIKRPDTMFRDLESEVVGGL